MGLFNFLSRKKKGQDKGIPASESPDRMLVSVAMVNELLSVYRSRGFKGDPRVKMIGDNLWQLGGSGSLTIAKDKIKMELGQNAAIELNDSWSNVTSQSRDPTAAREIILIEKAGMMTDSLLNKK